jgi:hypothetical protein
MVTRIDHQGIDRNCRNKRIIRHRSPICGVTAAVSCFPNTAANTGRVGYDAAVGCGGWVNNDIVEATFRCAVVEAAATPQSCARVGDRAR